MFVDLRACSHTSLIALGLGIGCGRGGGATRTVDSFQAPRQAEYPRKDGPTKKPAPKHHKNTTP
eukprot:9483893-Pyramimonas_sp.AAC.3